MAMQNFGPNSLQQEHQQLKHTPPNNVSDTAWHNTGNDNSTDSRQSMASSISNINNNNNNNSNNNNNNNNNISDNDTNQKISTTDTVLASGNSAQNRQPPQQQQPPHSQSQQYHGIFSPQIPASLQSSLASRVDQIIRTTLHDSPAYTPPTSKNSNTTNNNNNPGGVLPPNSTTNSNMPSTSSSSTLIFNSATTMIGQTVTPAHSNIHGLPPSSSGLMPSTTASSFPRSLYGPTSLSTLSDMPNNSGGGPNVNNNRTSAQQQQTSASHSALAAAAALQSLNQSHVQRSHQSANAQQAPFLNAAPVATTKPPSNVSGGPVPQAAHGNNSGNSSSNQMPKSCITTSMANSDHQKHTSFNPERAIDNLGDFASRSQPNYAGNTSNNNKMLPQSTALNHLPPNWQENASLSNGLMPRLGPFHNVNTSMASFPSSQSPYALISSAHGLPMGSNLTSGGPMLNPDGDSLARLNILRASNPHQFQDEKSLQSNIVSSMMKHGQLSSIGPSSGDMRLPTPQAQQNIAGSDAQDRITEEKLAIFAYNLLSAGIPGTNRCKQIIHVDDDMRDSIQNGEFYTKYDQVATGILTNMILVPNFSIIDYLRRDRFSLQEVERIESVNRKLSVANFSCLMELVRQRPFVPPHGKAPSTNEMNKQQLNNPITMNIARGMSFSQDNLLGAPQNTFMRNNNTSFISSSPNRHEMSGPLGVDKSRRSSQSPSDITRSQMGSNNNGSKIMNAPNQFPPSHLNSHHGSSLTNNQYFTSPPYLMNQSKPQHTSPQTNRSSPFQQPIVNPQMMTRPPRSQSTIGNLNIASFNSPFNPAPIRQPPAAHQNSSRPNLAALTSEMPAHAHTHTTTIPVTAHMSSKTPQTPRLPDSMSSITATLSSKNSPSSSGVMPNRSLQSQPDYIAQENRQELDLLQSLPIQTLLTLKQQELTNRDLAAKQSITPQYGQPGIGNIGQMSNIAGVDISRSSTENQFNAHPTNNAHQPLGSHNSSSHDLANITGYRTQDNMQFKTNMPPPTGSLSSTLDYQRSSQTIGDAASDRPNTSVTTSSASEINQYDALMAAYQQQQIMLSNKLIDNGPGALPPSNVNRSSASNRLGQPMIVDTQPNRQSQSQTNSPKSANQRSIITGAASTGPKRGKKAKLSPVAMNQTTDTERSNISTSDDVANLAQKIPDESDKHTGSVGNLTSSGQNSTLSRQSTADASPLVEHGNAHVANTPVDRPDRNASPARVASVFESASKENSSSSDIRPTNLSSIGAHVNLKDHCNLNELKALDETSLSETKSNNSSIADINLQTNLSTSSEPSKYRKLFTKKAWLKNYDEEDQARTSLEVPNTNDNNMIVQSAAVKVEPGAQIADDGDTNSDKSSPQTKLNGNLSNLKTSKPESKKRAKDVKSKKNSSISSIRRNRTPSKGVEHDSEETTASTSDLDDTDETDSVKSASNNKLRRMPRRKVKSSQDRDSADQSGKEVKPKPAKDSKEKEIVRKRGKKDKLSTDVASNMKRKCNSDDESVKQKTKKIKDDHIDTIDSVSPKGKKRPGERFLQTQPCYEIVPKTIRCLECRRVRQSSLKGDKAVQSKQSKANWDDFCRFFEFRKLRYNKAAQIVMAGFSDSSDAKDSDKQLWLPSGNDVPTNITYKVAKFILENIGDEFCKLVLKERSVIKFYETKSGDKRTTWKRAVNGLRELCDVCSTTLFNCHYVCERCGFVVCIDCHKSRAENHKELDIEAEVKKECGDSGDNSHDVSDQPLVANRKSKKDSFGWIFCARNEEHAHDKLALAKIIAGDCLEEVWSLLHDMRQRLHLKHCSCKVKPVSDEWDINQVSEDNVTIKQELDDGTEGSHSTLKGLLLATGNSPANGSIEADEKTINVERLREDGVLDFDNEDDSQDESKQVSAAIEGCIASLNIESQDEMPDCSQKSKTGGSHDKTHLKLCGGDLLVLTYSRHKENTRLFREHWREGKPVLVRGIHRRMNIDMWLPQFFSGKFGDYRSDLVDCRNGDIHRQSMRKYWDGFEPNPSKKRAKDDNIPGHIPLANNEEPSAVSTSYYSGSALWRLKDWPPGQDFKEILPEHYEDFMNNLPLSSYTTRTGRLNLACRLPKEMLKPDLGPKMYSAYGTTKFPERGTTNLHLDISDAVNVMVYVGGARPFLQGSAEYGELFDKTVDECRVDPLMKAQIKEQNLIPGALWHIFRPSDVHKMRDFLNKVADECKLSLEKRNDPIHDQIWYLDQTLLDRLYKEHGVKSYPILQCMGDAILIPAGAPHQVKNLQNCIKVANDFVSPENVRYCLQLTDEFRNLPETHINQEDKLQIKNILYHSVKESIQYINMFESGRISAEDEPSDEDD